MTKIRDAHMLRSDAILSALHNGLTNRALNLLLPAAPMTDDEHNTDSGKFTSTRNNVLQSSDEYHRGGAATSWKKTTQISFCSRTRPVRDEEKSQSSPCKMIVSWTQLVENPGQLEYKRRSRRKLE